MQLKRSLLATSQGEPERGNSLLEKIPVAPTMDFNTSDDKVRTGTLGALTGNRNPIFSDGNASELYDVSDQTSDELETLRLSKSYQRSLEKLGVLGISQGNGTDSNSQISSLDLKGISGSLRRNLTEELVRPTQSLDQFTAQMQHLEAQMQDLEAQEGDVKGQMQDLESQQGAVEAERLRGATSANVNATVNATLNVSFRADLGADLNVSFREGVNSTESTNGTSPTSPKKKAWSKQEKKAWNKKSQGNKKSHGKSDESLQEELELDYRDKNRALNRSFLGRMGIHPVQAVGIVFLVIMFACWFGKLYRERNDNTW